MKNFLHTLPYFLLFLFLTNLSPLSYGQCTCSGGDPATPLSYYVRLDTTDAPSSILSFPKFDPSTGILACIRFLDTLSLVSTSDVINTASVPVTYRFLLSVTNDIVGPGISVNESASRNYGPTLLQQAGDVGDRTVYGPDTLFQSSTHSTSAGGLASYLGSSGNVDFTYTVNGGLISTQGGINYTYQIVSKYWGGFRLTYFWCPNVVLATNIKNFSVAKKDNIVLVKFVTDNKSSDNKYEIQVSHDGKTFTNEGQSNPLDPTALSLQYQYQYLPGNGSTGKIYFRIKQTDAQGKITYSVVRSVDMNENAAAGFTIYPNPVNSKVAMQFDRTLNGTYVVEVTNLAGQVMYNRNMKLVNTTSVQFDLANPPPSGMYYLRVTDTKTRQSQSNKLIIRR